MTQRQQRFVEEYCIDWNGTQAALRAGFSEKGAATEAWRMLRNAEIRTAIADRTAELLEAAEISQARVLLELKALAFSDIRRVYDAQGQLRRIDTLPDGVAAAIKKAKIVMRPIPNGGGEVEYVMEIELHGKEVPLGLLGKRLRLFPDRVVLENDDKRPIAIRIVHETGALPPAPGDGGS